MTNIGRYMDLGERASSINTIFKYARGQIKYLMNAKSNIIRNGFWLFQ